MYMGILYCSAKFNKFYFMFNILTTKHKIYTVQSVLKHLQTMEKLFSMYIDMFETCISATNIYILHHGEQITPMMMKHNFLCGHVSELKTNNTNLGFSLCVNIHSYWFMQSFGFRSTMTPGP